jgi:hypothetical protein
MKINKFWHDYSIDCNLLTNFTIKNSLKIFWNEVMSDLGKFQFVYIIMKVRFSDGTVASISKMQTANKSMFKEVLDIFIFFSDHKAENYTSKSITNIIFQYHINTMINNNIKARLSKKATALKTPTFTFGGYKFPLTTDLSKWGTIVSDIKNQLTIEKESSKYTYHITKETFKHIVKVYLNEKLMMEFTDKILLNLTDFDRTIGNHIYRIRGGKVVLKTLTRKTKFLAGIKLNKLISNKFISLDIETRNVDGIINPYCISYFDGVKSTSFYLSDFINAEEMLKSAIRSLKRYSYNGYKIYIHNLSNFDGIFLLKHLTEIPQSILSPVIKDGKMISLTFSWFANERSNKSYSFEFRDSLLMLPSSLAKLAKSFQFEDKGIFPYDFANEAPLDYIGEIPSIKYFGDLTLKDYNLYRENYPNNVWNLREETIKYCELDCVLLWKIIDKFNELIFDKYSLNIHRFPTLPSLAFGIFRGHYLKSDTIPLINGQMYHEIRSGYTGGHTDVYKTYGENIHRYDVNSLYPFVMSKFPSPVGAPSYFEGDITKFEENPFGFFEVEVTSPSNMERPLLQTRVKTSGGMRTMAPLGSWRDMIYSEEMKEYLKYGYTFKVLRGYLFERGFIFTDYVNDLYKIKQSHSKDDPMYLISKLLMNSLYGRFGMTPNLVEHAIIDNSLLEDFLSKKEFDVIECLDLKNGKNLISYQSSEENVSADTPPNVNIAIAASITAYARVHMSQFLADPTLQIYYTDTDSIDVKGNLPSRFIGPALGQLKVEDIFDEAIFLAPKVYGGLGQRGPITKIKGFKNPISFNSLKSLLIKDSKLDLNQEKWFKSISEGNISVRNQIYSLMVTDNKRQLIYDKHILIGTKPYIIDGNKEINSI